MVKASDSGSRGRGSSPTRVKPRCVLEQGTPQKVLVIPRKQWLRPNMTEKLFTGTLRDNQPTNHVGFELVIVSVTVYCLSFTSQLCTLTTKYGNNNASPQNSAEP